MAKKCVGKFPKAFRQMAVDQLNQCENIVTLAKELGVSRLKRVLAGKVLEVDFIQRDLVPNSLQRDAT